jgi:hypothetical protein
MEIFALAEASLLSKGRPRSQSGGAGIIVGAQAHPLRHPMASQSEQEGLR